MSEANILNPTASSPLSPDYPPWVERLPDPMLEFQAKSGDVYSRLDAVRGRTIEMGWSDRLQTTIDQLDQWEAQYRDDFFSFYDIERNRYYSGRFAAPLEKRRAGYNKWSASGTFTELPGLALYAYPSDWTNHAIFKEERDGFGADRVKLTGAGWGFATSANYHGGAAYLSNVTDDAAEWLYYGYGCRVWSTLQAGMGIMAVSVDGGVETNVDCYRGLGAHTNQAVYTNASLPLGIHRVKLRVTGTKNASSSDYFIAADAIEVMQ